MTHPITCPFCDQREQELVKVREELDRYKADSEALDWLEKYVNLKAVYLSTQISETGDVPTIPEHLRKRLEGK